jgi:hypothetical protein
VLIQNKIDCHNTIIDIYNTLRTDMFAWYWNENQIDAVLGYERDEYAAFTHIFYNGNQINSGFFDMASNLIKLITDKEQIKYKSLGRIQANLLQNININDAQLSNSIHHDMPTDNYISIIYYVMDSDGDTVILHDDKEIRVPPIQGNYVIFKSNTKHRATIPQINKRRMVINCVLEI